MHAALHLTRNQELVLNALSRTAGPASAYVLLDRLRSEGLRGPPQIYRALEKLIEFGLVHKLESLNAFVACAHPHDHAGAHAGGDVTFAICDACGRVDEFCDAALGRQLAARAGAMDFKPSKTTIEMRGTCGACLSGAANRP